MPDGFPCPNPTCTQVFPPDAVKGAAALTCPRCGTVYQFRSPAPEKKPAAPARQTRHHRSPPKTFHPPPPPPVAPPVPIAPVAPLAYPAAQAPAPHLHLEDSSERVLSRRSRRRRGGWVKLLVGLLVFLVAAGGIALGVYLLVQNLPGDDDTNPAHLKKQGNFAFTIPPGWHQDPQLKLKMKVHLALKAGKQPSYMGLYFRDYATREPGDGELLDEAMKKLHGYFATVEYEDPFKGPRKGRTDTLGGEPAIVLPFQATDRNQVVMQGQVVMLTRQGYAYWLFTWGPEDHHDQLVEGWAALREHFKLFNDREGWKPLPRPVERYLDPELNVRLTYAKDMWHKADNPKDHDERAVLVLRGFEPSEDEKGRKRVEALAGKAATVEVLVLPAQKGAEAAHKAALEHIRKKLEQTNPEVKIDPVTDRKSGRPSAGVEVGNLRGKWARLRIGLGPDTQRFALLAVASLPKGVLALYAECRWERRDFWDQEFKDLIETVREAPKGPSD